MNLLLIILWICVVSVISLFGSGYARRHNKPDALIGLYVSFVLISNILAYKIAAYDLGFTVFYAPAAVLIFAVTFLLTDIVNEKFGRKETQKMIFIAFVTQIAVAIFVYISLSLPAAPFWTDAEAFQRILGFTPRLMLASFLAFLISENADAYIFSALKKKTQGKHLWMRNAFSSIPAMALDTVIFVTVAFIGVQPLWPLILGVVALKWLVGLIDIPFMYLNRHLLYRK